MSQSLADRIETKLVDTDVVYSCDSSTLRAYVISDVIIDGKMCDVSFRAIKYRQQSMLLYGFEVTKFVSGRHINQFITPNTHPSVGNLLEILHGLHWVSDKLCAKDDTDLHGDLQEFLDSGRD